YLSSNNTVYTINVIFFFFSSRRRHTRFSRDWSSDVCSSDLRSIIQEIRFPKPIRASGLTCREDKVFGCVISSRTFFTNLKFRGLADSICASFFPLRAPSVSRKRDNFFKPSILSSRVTFLKSHTPPSFFFAPRT